MFVISAYAPPTFLEPVLVWMTCQCEDTGEGAHMLGCWTEALNTSHALEMLGQALADSHTPGKHTPSPWFLIGEFPSPFAALEVHVRMALDMQNGRGNELWEAGWEPYKRMRDQYRDAPPYRTLVKAEG